MKRRKTALFMAIVMMFVQMQGTGFVLAAEEETFFLEEIGEEPIADVSLNQSGEMTVQADDEDIFVEEDLDGQAHLIEDVDESVSESGYEDEPETEQDADMQVETDLLEICADEMDMTACESTEIGEDSIWLTTEDDEDFVFSDGTRDLWLEANEEIDLEAFSAQFTVGLWNQENEAWNHIFTESEGFYTLRDDARGLTLDGQKLFETLQDLGAADSDIRIHAQIIQDKDGEQTTVAGVEKWITVRGVTVQYQHQEDVHMLRNEKITIPRTGQAIVTNSENPYGAFTDYTVTDVALAGSSPAVRLSKVINGDNEEVVEWSIRARMIGNTTVTVTYLDLQGETQTYNFTVYVDTEMYDVDVWRDGKDSALPGETMTFHAQAHHRRNELGETYEVDTDDPSVSSLTYSWEVTEGADVLRNGTITPDPADQKTASVTVRDIRPEEAGDFWHNVTVTVRVYEGTDESGQPLERAAKEISFTAADYFTVLYPFLDTIDPNLGLFETTSVTPDVRYYYLDAANGYDSEQYVRFRWYYDPSQVQIVDCQTYQIVGNEDGDGVYIGRTYADNDDSDYGRSYTIERLTIDPVTIYLSADTRHEDESGNYVWENLYEKCKYPLKEQPDPTIFEISLVNPRKATLYSDGLRTYSYTVKVPLGDELAGRVRVTADYVVFTEDEAEYYPMNVQYPSDDSYSFILDGDEAQALKESYGEGSIQVVFHAALASNPETEVDFTQESFSFEDAHEHREFELNSGEVLIGYESEVHRDSTNGLMNCYEGQNNKIPGNLTAPLTITDVQTSDPETVSVTETDFGWTVRGEKEGTANVTLIYTDWSGQEGCRHESTLRVAPETYDVWIDLADGAVSDLFPGDSVQVIARYGVRHADGYGKDNTEHDISYEWKWAVQRYDEDNDDYIDIDPDSADCPVTFTPENDHLLIGTEEGITGQMRILPTVTLYVDGEERARTYAGEPEICVKEDLMQIQIGQLNTELSVGETTQADFTLIRKYLENHDGNISAYTDRTPPYYDDDSPQEWGFAVLYDPAVLEVKANGETLQPVIFTEDGCDFWEVSEYYEYRKQHSSPYVLPVTRTPATLSVTKLKEGTNAGLILWAVRYGSYDDGSDDEMWCVQLYKNWDFGSLPEEDPKEYDISFNQETYTVRSNGSVTASVDTSSLGNLDYTLTYTIMSWSEEDSEWKIYASSADDSGILSATGFMITIDGQKLAQRLAGENVTGNLQLHVLASTGEDPETSLASAVAGLTMSQVYTVTYVFAAVDADGMPTGESLPKQIMALKPSGLTADSGSTVEPAREEDLAFVTYPTAGGSWAFNGYVWPDGYETDQPFTLRENMTVTGRWRYQEEYHRVIWSFTDDQGENVPEALGEYLPPEAEKQKGTSFTLTAPFDSVDLGEDTWHFTGWTWNQIPVSGKVEMGDDDIHLVGICTKEPTYELSYSFAYEYKDADEGTQVPGTELSDDQKQELEALLTNELPQADRKKAGDVVTLSHPAIGQKVETEHGQWTFTGYRQGDQALTEVTMNTADMEVTGVWEYVPDLVTVSYLFRSTGSKPLPDSVKELLPASVKVLKNTVYESVETPDGEVPTQNGKWTFNGYTLAGTAVSGSVAAGSENITLTGSWTYTDEYYPVKYHHEADAESAQYDFSVVSETMPDSFEDALKGSTVTPVSPAVGTLVEDNAGGKWIFSGYEPVSITIDEQVKEGSSFFTGRWKYEEAPVYTVTYTFISATQGKTLPTDIQALLPAPQAFAQGTEVTFTEPSSLRVETANGVWTFNGYNKETQAISEDLQVTGSWTYEDELHTLTYVFVSADGKDLPQEVMTYLPEAQEGLVKGSVITLKDLTKYTVRTDDNKADIHGVWSFARYRSVPAIVGDEDLTVTAVWRFTADERENEVPAETAQAVITGEDVTNPQEITDTITNTDNQKLIDSIETANDNDTDTAIDQLQDLTNKLDDKLVEQSLKTVTGGSGDDSNNYSLSVGATMSGTASVDGETVEVSMTGAAATVASVISSMPDETAQELTQEGHNELKAEVIVRVDEASEDTSLQMDISINVTDKDGRPVEEDMHNLAAPVTVTLSIPTRYQNKDFTLMHYPNGRDGNGVQISYKWNDSRTQITFVLPDLSPVDLVGLTCMDGNHDWYETNDKLEASCTAEGYIVRACANGCEATSRQVIPKKQHSYEKVEAVAATCLEAGHIEYYTCKDCHELAIKDGDGWKKVTESEVVQAATGHETEFVDIDSDGSSTGNVAYYNCKHGCGTLFADAAGKEEVTREQIAKATEVRDLINSLPAAPGIGDQAKVDAASEAFTALSAKEKAMLNNGCTDGTVTPEAKLKKAVAAVKKAVADKKKKDDAAKAAAVALKVGNYDVSGKELQLKFKQKYNGKIKATGTVTSVVSSNSKVVSVTCSGNTVNLKAGKKKGTAVITVMIGREKRTFTVKVSKKKVTAKTAVNFPKKLTMKVKETKNLGVYILPITTPDKLKFSSTKKSIVSVNKKTGVIVAKKKGKAVIELKVGKKKFKCKVTVQ